MAKRQKKREFTKTELIEMALMIAISISVFYFINFSYTGFVVFESSNDTATTITKAWSFTNLSEYSYNNSEIEIADGKASLKNITLIKSVKHEANEFLEGNLTNATVNNGEVELAIKEGWRDSNYKYRKKFNVINNAAVALNDYSVKLTLDTASLVNAGKMKNDCSDLRIAYNNSEIDRDVVNCNNADTEVWFKTQQDISEGNADEYYIYYGYDGASSPLNDESKVYLWFDDFSTNTLSNYNLGDHLCFHGGCSYKEAVYADGRVYADTGNDYDTGLRVIGINEENVLARADFFVNNTYTSNSTLGIGLRWEDNDDYYSGHISGGEYKSPFISKEKRDKKVEEPETNTYHAMDQKFILQFAVWDENQKLWYNDVLQLQGDDDKIDESGEVVFNIAQASGWMDNFLIRKYYEPEPSVTLESEETRYENNGEVISKKETLDVDLLDTITWQAVENGNANVKLQIRTASTEDELDNALWQPADYYESSGSINSNNKWFQYRIVLEGNEDTPEIESVAVNGLKNITEASSITTEDLVINNPSTGLITKADSGNISYYYSTDSGSSWNEINDFSVNLGSKLRMKAEISNGYVEEINLTYSYCREEWTCTEHSACMENGTKSRECTDSNICGTAIDKPEEVSSCLYIEKEYKLNDSGKFSTRANETIMINFTDALLNLRTSKDILNSTINISKEMRNLTISNGKFLKQIHIENLSSEVNENLIEAQLKVPYNDSEIQSLNLDENTLKIYYYNETSGSWKEVPSEVSINENYVVGNLTHFSTYAVVGEQKKAPSPAPSGGSGSSSSNDDKKEETAEEVEDEKGYEIFGPNNVERERSVVEEETVTEKIVEDEGEVEETTIIDKVTGFITHPEGIIELTRENISLIAVALFLVLGYSTYRISSIIRRKHEPKVEILYDDKKQ